MVDTLTFLKSRKTAWESAGPLCDKGVKWTLRDNEAVPDKTVTASLSLLLKVLETCTLQ